MSDHFHKKLAVSLLILFTVILIYFNTREGFASNNDKAQFIYDWFTKNNHHSYTSYRKATNYRSNIVEYNMALDLINRGEFTVDNVKKVIVG